MDAARRYKPSPGRQLRLLVAFTVLYVTLIATPALADTAFPLRRDLQWGAIVDLATPVVLLSLVWLLVSSATAVSGRVLAVLVVISIFWTQGQGMHLAANAISHQIDDTTAPALAGVVAFLDETLSHYLWHVGILAIPALFLAVSRSATGGTAAGSRRIAMTAGLVWGAIMALGVIESVVVPLALPVLAVLAAAAGMGWRRSGAGPRPSPVYDYAAAGCVSAVLVLIGWGAYHGGWPELSEVGLL